MPTLLVIEDGQTYSGRSYQGEFKKDHISRFLHEYSLKKEETRVQVIFDINQACQNMSYCLVLASPQVQKTKTFLEGI